MGNLKTVWLLRWHRVALVAKLRGPPCAEPNDAPTPSQPRPHNSQRVLLVGPRRSFGKSTSTPIGCRLLLRHCVGQPSPHQSSEPLRTLPLSSWALLSVHVALPCPSRAVELNVWRGRSGSWDRSLTLRAGWSGFKSWLSLCDLGQVTLLPPFPHLELQQG